MPRNPLSVEVVAAHEKVWDGKATSIIARTMEGDIGILPGHEPLMALLVPCVVEIVTADGHGETLTVDGGFISVAHDRVYVLSQVVQHASDISAEQAQRELDQLHQIREAGEATDKQVHHIHMLRAQLRAVEISKSR